MTGDCSTMMGYRELKPNGLIPVRKLPTKYLVTVPIFLICFYFIWMATSRLEDYEMSKKDTNFRRTALRPVSSDGNSLPNSTHDLMIFSYMRSGSTMTGEVFAENSDFFFVFEPLLSIVPYQYLTSTDVCKMRNLECSSGEFNKKLDEATDVLRNIYSCNLRQIQPNTLDYITRENKSGATWSKFSECANSALTERNLNIESAMSKSGTAQLLNHCFDKLERPCRNSRAKVTKVLRLSMRLIPKLLSQIPTLKILLLVRDPRAIMNSRLITDWFPVCEKDWFTVFENARSLCKKMQDDIYVLYRLKNLFPDRLLIHRLEDVVVDSPELFKGIFSFMNLRNMDLEMERIKTKYVNKNYDGFIGKWKTMLKDKFKKQVEESCEKVLRYYEYVK